VAFGRIIEIGDGRDHFGVRFRLDRTLLFFVENNKPATFTYPVWSLRGDLKLWWEVVTLQRGY